MSSLKDPKAEACERALADLHQALTVPYALIGGGAARLYGSPREWSNDIDLLLEAQHILRAGEDLRWNLAAAEISMQTFILQGIDIDILEADTPFRKKVIRQAITIDIPGGRIRIAMPDHLILMKAQHLRPKDKIDIRAVARTAGFTPEGIQEAKTLGLWNRIRPLVTLP